MTAANGKKRFDLSYKHGWWNPCFYWNGNTEVMWNKNDRTLDRKILFNEIINEYSM